MDIGKRLKELMDTIGITPTELHQRSGVSRSMADDVIKGKKAPTVDTIQKWCDALGVTLKDFFSEAELTSGSINSKRLLKRLEGYTPEQINVFMRFLDDWKNVSTSYSPKEHDERLYVAEGKGKKAYKLRKESEPPKPLVKSASTIDQRKSMLPPEAQKALEEIEQDYLRRFKPRKDDE